MSRNAEKLTSNEPAASSDGWKLRYLDCVDELERLQAQHEHVESLLYRSLGRLSLALYCAGDSLQEPLDRLRQALRDRQPAERLSEHVEAIHAACQTLERASEPGPEQPGLNEVLADFLERLDLLDAQNERIDELRRRLRSAVTERELPAVLGAMAGLVADLRRDLQTQRIEIERFLLRLDGRLREIDQFLDDADEVRRSRLDRCRLLEHDVAAEVQAVHGQLEQATDLASLKRLVEDRLEAIGAHLARHVRAEEKLARESERTIRELREELAAAQAESEGLAAASSDTSPEVEDAWEARIRQEHARWERYGTPVSVALLGIDRLESIRARFGQKAGDKVLDAVTQLVRSQVRSSDFVTRRGAEHVVVLMPHTNSEEARRGCAGLQRSIERACFRHRNTVVEVSLSCGITEVGDDDSADDVARQALQRAGRSLAAAKARKRRAAA